MCCGRFPLISLRVRVSPGLTGSFARIALSFERISLVIRSTVNIFGYDTFSLRYVIRLFEISVVKHFNLLFNQNLFGFVDE